MFNKAASSIEVEHTQVRRLVGSHVQQGSQQYRGGTHSGTYIGGITCSTRQPAV